MKPSRDFSGRIGATVVLSVSATGLSYCAALLFLPAILAVVLVAEASSVFGFSPALLAAALLPSLALALALGSRVAARIGASLLRVEVATAAGFDPRQGERTDR